MALLERRIGLLFAVFLALLLLAGGRALFLGAIKGSSLASAATNQQVSSIELPARRGTIVDRNGFELAVSEPADDVSATWYLVKDPIKTANKLAPLLGVDADAIINLGSPVPSGPDAAARDACRDFLRELLEISVRLLRGRFGSTLTRFRARQIFVGLQDRQAVVWILAGVAFGERTHGV